MSNPMPDEAAGPGDAWLRERIAEAVGPTDLRQVSDGELAILLEAHCDATYGDDRVEELRARFQAELAHRLPAASRPSAAASTPSAVSTPLAAASHGGGRSASAAGRSPILGFLANLMRSDGWPGVTTVGGYVIAALSAAVLALAVTVVLLVRGLVLPAGPGELAESPQGERAVESGAVPLPAHENRPSPQPPAPSPQSPAATSVATLSRLHGVRWAGARLALAEMDRLAPGQDVQFDAGRAEINFDAGVRMVVEGPARLRILGPLKVQAHLGGMAARVGKDGRGFSVVTPKGEIVDLGTEFGLRIDGSGREDVAVFEGSLDVDYGPAASAAEPTRRGARRLVQGEGIRVGAEGEMSRLVAIADDTFPRQVQPPPARRPVITSVSDSLRRPDCKKFYEIVHGGLQHRVQAYVDSTHWKWGMPKGSIPAELVGADYVKMFTEDVNRRDVEISVDLAQAADLYVLLDDRTIKYNYGKPPAWLDRFERTGWKIVLDEGFPEHPPENPAYTYPGKPFSIYRLRVPGAQTVKLGGNGLYSAEELERHKDTWNADMAMYGIVAVARAASTAPAAKGTAANAGRAPATDENGK